MANPNLQKVTHKRNSKGEKYWKKTPFKIATYYKNEIEILKKSEVKVNTLYLKEQAKENFSEMSQETNGICSKLDIDSEEGGKLLTNMITE